MNVALNNRKTDSDTANAGHPIRTDRKPLRILYHHRTLGDGAEGIHIREMVNAFRELGHTVQIVSMGDSESRDSVSSMAQKLGWIKSWIPKAGYEFAELGYNLVGRRKLNSAIRTFRPHLIYDRYNTFCNAAVKAGQQARLPVFLEVNSPLAYERRVHDTGLFFPRLAEQYETNVCQLATHVFAVSTPLREFLVTQRQVPAEKISVLPNGANPKFFVDEKTRSVAKADRLSRIGLPENAIVIGFTGILRKWHGVELLCRAFYRLSQTNPEVHLLLVGDGPCEKEIRNMVFELGIAERVTFTSRVSHDQVRDCIRLMDIGVSPKATFYASPMKILEYMAMSLPVVAPDMPNIRDLVNGDLDHGGNGLLFRDDDEDSLFNSLQKLVCNSELRAALGESGRYRIETELNWRRNAKKVVDEYFRSSGPIEASDFT